MNKNLTFVFAIIITILSSCSISEKSPDQEYSKAQTIINQTIKLSGGDLYDMSNYSFDFRNMKYIGSRNLGKFNYQRLFSDSTGDYKDSYFNEGFTRKFNDAEITVADSMAFKYSNSINSVFYFALLPFGLNDAAVIKEYLGTDTIKGQTYHEIEVAFEQEGGGKDFEDIFVYWINTETGFIDYFGYTYITDGGGARFREAYNPRIVNGIRFQDYVNYKPVENTDVPLHQFDSLLTNNQLIKVSVIELENIEVSRVNNKDK